LSWRENDDHGSRGPLQTEISMPFSSLTTSCGGRKLAAGLHRARWAAPWGARKWITSRDQVVFVDEPAD
jgi:hypothetical protein